MRSKASRRRVHRPNKARRVAADRTRIGLILAAIVVALTIGTIAFSRSSTQAQKKRYVATKEIILDKASGKLRKPTAQETEELVDQLKSLTNRSTEGLTVTQHSNGMASMNLEGRFGGVVLGRAKADGTTEVRCVFTMEEAEEFLGLVASTSQDQ
jgi:uncharacterized protein HemX